MTVIIKVGRREQHQKNTKFKFFIFISLIFSVSHKKITVLFRYTVYFPSKTQRSHSQKHHLFSFTTSIILTFYHFLTFRLQILKNRNDIEQNRKFVYSCIFNLLIFKNISETTKTIIYSTKIATTKTLCSQIQVQEKEDEVRDEEEHGRLQKSTRMISNHKNKEIQDNSPKEPRRLAY